MNIKTQSTVTWLNNESERRRIYSLQQDETNGLKIKNSKLNQFKN